MCVFSAGVSASQLQTLTETCIPIILIQNKEINTFLRRLVPGMYILLSSNTKLKENNLVLKATAFTSATQKALQRRNLKIYFKKKEESTALTFLEASS